MFSYVPQSDLPILHLELAKVYVPKSHCKNTNDVKIFSPNLSVSPVDMFAKENYLDEAQYTECKRTNRRVIKESKEFKEGTGK